jgi:hypothetical protein
VQPDVTKHAPSLPGEAYALAAKAKDTAPPVVYVTEWLVLSGALLACGSVLWSLMVRRRLHRQVHATRIRTQR